MDQDEKKFLKFMKANGLEYLVNGDELGFAEQEDVYVTQKENELLAKIVALIFLKDKNLDYSTDFFQVVKIDNEYILEFYNNVTSVALGSGDNLLDVLVNFVKRMNIGD